MRYTLTSSSCVVITTVGASRMPARFSTFRPSVPAIKAHVWGLLTGRAEPHLSHNPLGAVMVYPSGGELGQRNNPGPGHEYGGHTCGPGREWPCRPNEGPGK